MAEEEEEDKTFSEWEQISSSPTHSTASNSTTATQHNQEQENPNSSSASDETSSDSEDHNLQQQHHWYFGFNRRHVRLSYEALCTKVVSLVDQTRRRKMGFGQFVSLSGVLVAVVVSLMYVKMRRLVDKFNEREVQLVALINIKDEKIRQLVVQLAHMNELLSGRRKVPVLRIHHYSQSA